MRERVLRERIRQANNSTVVEEMRSVGNKERITARI